MNREYRRAPTSAEVWAVIKARHDEDLCVFGSFSDPDGTFNDGPGTRGRMFTSYGFKGADFPLMAAETTWEIDPEQPHVRRNQSTEYWLCLPLRRD